MNVCVIRYLLLYLYSFIELLLNFIQFDIICVGNLINYIYILNSNNELYYYYLVVDH